MRTIIVAMGMKVRMAMVFIVCMYVCTYVYCIIQMDMPNGARRLDVGRTLLLTNDFSENLVSSDNIHLQVNQFLFIVS